MSFKVLITTIPFAQNNDYPIELLKKAGISFDINPLGRKLKEEDLFGLIDDYDGLIAGTEEISHRTLTKTGKLKFISRVGIGLDGIDLNFALNKGIKISYTPDAPSPAVAELTVGLMLNELRKIGTSNKMMHQGMWERHFGRRLAEVTVGLVGLGRIGKKVYQILKGFGCRNILLHDIEPKREIEGEWCKLDHLLTESDVVSLHIPLTGRTKSLIKKDELERMKSDAILINTSRGGIVDEDDLYLVLKENRIASAAVDVFETEPYEGGKLSTIENCTLTSHMGSMSVDCRERMEIEATEEMVRFFKNEPLKNEVPSHEVEAQMMESSYE